MNEETLNNLSREEAIKLLDSQMDYTYQLEHNWNELKKWLREVEEVRYYLTCYQRYEVFIDKIINKMQELEEGGNNDC